MLASPIFSRIISFWHDNIVSVCLSVPLPVMLGIVVKRYILQQKASVGSDMWYERTTCSSGRLQGLREVQIVCV